MDRIDRKRAAYLLLTLSLSGCGRPRILAEPYPLWGEAVELKSGGGSRHMQILQPERGSAKACLLIVHGMNEYIGRYGPIARYFADDTLVAGIDLSAHGLSNAVIARADANVRAGGGGQDISAAYLEQAGLDGMQSMREDLEQAVRFLGKMCAVPGREKRLPLFILTHSLGSLVAASWLLNADNAEMKEAVDGVIFTGPAFSVTQVPGWRGWLQNPFIRFTFHIHEHFLHPHDEALPVLLFNQTLSLLTVPLLDGLIEGSSLPGMRRLFSPSTPDWVVEYLSDWEDERNRHRADPLIVRRTLLRYVLAVEKEVIAFRRGMAGFDTPYLLIYSERDPITPAWGGRDFAAASAANHPHNEVVELAGESHHEHLFSSPILRQRILAKIKAWLDLRMTVL